MGGIAGAPHLKRRAIVLTGLLFWSSWASGCAGHQGREEVPVATTASTEAESSRESNSRSKETRAPAQAIKLDATMVKLGPDLCWQRSSGSCLVVNLIRAETGSVGFRKGHWFSQKAKAVVPLKGDLCESVARELEGFKTTSSALAEPVTLLVGPGTPERHILWALEELRSCGWSQKQIEIGCQPPLTPSEIASAAGPPLTWEVPPGPDAVPLLEELNTRQAQLSACLSHGSGRFTLSAELGVDGVLRQVVATPSREGEPESCTEYDQEMGRCTREVSGADPHYDPVEIACLEYYFRGFRFPVDESEDAEPRRITFQLEGEETSN